MYSFKLLLVFLLISASHSILSAQGIKCSESDPFCADAGAVFLAAVNTNLHPDDNTNNYGCLGAAYNPAWYYLKIGDTGPIQLTLSNSNNIDIDFIIWGPFADLSTATSSCGSYTFSQIADCSFDAGATEIVDFTAATTGDIYILLITNFANSPTDISVAQTGGTGSTDCGIIGPSCDADAGTFSTTTLSVDEETAVSISHNGNHEATYTQEYILTNKYDYILQIQSTPSFGVLAVGDYKILAINYDTGGVDNLSVGTQTAVLTGACFALSSAVDVEVNGLPPCGSFSSIIQN